MAEPTYEDADALIGMMGKARIRAVEGGMTARDVAHLYLKQIYTIGVRDAGGSVAVRRTQGRFCGCPFTGGTCEATFGGRGEK